MTKIDDGGPAFPMVAMNDPGHPATVHGMSLRDWFAGQALAGYIANPNQSGMKAAMIARDCYGIADAMLAERARANREDTK